MDFTEFETLPGWGELGETIRDLIQRAFDGMDGDGRDKQDFLLSCVTAVWFSSEDRTGEFWENRTNQMKDFWAIWTGSAQLEGAIPGEYFLAYVADLEGEGEPAPPINPQPQIFGLSATVKQSLRINTFQRRNKYPNGGKLESLKVGKLRS